MKVTTLCSFATTGLRLNGRTDRAVMFRLSCAALWGSRSSSRRRRSSSSTTTSAASPKGRIAQYGNLPFCDYLDPGYFLTELSSAAVQRIFGDNLLGEGTPDIRVHRHRHSSGLRSCAPGFSVIDHGSRRSLIALLLFPRAYDYDKVLFLPLGSCSCGATWTCRLSRVLWALAAGAAASSLYRYDTGIFVAGAAVVAMAVLHSGGWTTLARRLGHFGIAVGCFALPFLASLQYGGGVANALDQTLAYRQARNRPNAAVDTTPASIPVLARVVEAPPAQLKVPSEPLWIRAQRAFPLLRVRLLPGAWHVGNADAFLYTLFRLLPLVAGLILVANLRRLSSASRVEIASIASVIVLSFALNAFILRDPVSARFGGMAAPTAILAAWTVHRVLQLRSSIARHLLEAALVAGLAATVWSTSLSADWSVRMPPEVFRPRHMISVARGLRESPPLLDRLQKDDKLGIVRYLRECTGRRDRVLIGWFAPDIYFFAQRGFAAGAVAFFGQHWSEPRFQSSQRAALRVRVGSGRHPAGGRQGVSSGLSASHAVSRGPLPAALARPTLTMRRTVAEDIAFWFVATGEPIACTR